MTAAARDFLSRAQLASPLDTKGITRHSEQNRELAGGRPAAALLEVSPAERDRRWEERKSWLRAVGEQTKEHREYRARRYETKGRYRALGANNDAEGMELRRRRFLKRFEVEIERYRAEEERAHEIYGRPLPPPFSAFEECSVWHMRRAAGQRARVESVIECGEVDSIELECLGCGTAKEKGARCGSKLLCRSCRSMAMAIYHQRFGMARHDLLHEAKFAGLMNHFRQGGRWTEKFCTFTVPHIGTTEFRQTVLQRAYARVMRSIRRDVERGVQQRLGVLGPKGGLTLRKHLSPENRAEVERVMRLFSYLRAYEWTTGEDKLGHSHVHIWMFGPFIDRARVRELWANALSNAGMDVDAEDLILPDVRAAQTGIERELIKYMTKDIVDGQGKAAYVDPETYATVYRLLDGCRQVQGSRGFMKRAGGFCARCENCALDGCFRVRFTRGDREALQKSAPSPRVHAARVAKMKVRAKALKRKDSS